MWEGVTIIDILQSFTQFEGKYHWTDAEIYHQQDKFHRKASTKITFIEVLRVIF